MPTATTAQRIAATVRAELARRQISGAKLAEQLGWSQPYVQRRLSGRVAFDVDELGRIADVLSIDLADLVGGEAVA